MGRKFDTRKSTGENKMRKIFLMMGMLVMSSISQKSLADTRIYPGTACLTDGTFSYSPYWGIANPSNSYKTALCPIRRLQDGTPWQEMLIGYFDRNIGVGQNIDCYVWTSNSDGSGYTSSYGYSTALETDYRQIVMSNTASGWSNIAQVIVECSVPPISSTSGASHLVNIQVTD